MGLHEGNEVAGNKFSDEILALRDRLFFGHCGPWLFAEKVLGSAYGNVRYQVF